MNQQIYKKNVIIILLTTLLLLMAYALLIYVVDPLQQFRMAKFYKPLYLNEAYENPGLAKNYHYDSVIIGSSMTQNFLPSYVNYKLKVSSVKLSLAGMNSFEAKYMLQTALATGKVNRVIYCVDVFVFAANEVRANFPFYLYSEKLTDKFKYLFNIGNVQLLMRIVMGNLGLAYQEHLSLDMAYNWNKQSVFSSENVWKSFEINKKADKRVFNIEQMKQNFNKNLLAVIKANPNVSFSLFHPPYSILMYKLYAEEDNLQKFLAFKKYIFEATKHLPNVKIYDFQTDLSISKNLNNYKDIGHFSMKINHFIIDSMTHNKYLITEQNINQSLATSLYV